MTPGESSGAISSVKLRVSFASMRSSAFARVIWLPDARDRSVQAVAETLSGRVLVSGCHLYEDARNGLAAEVMDDLRRAVQAGCLMEVPHGIQEDELDARDLYESSLGLQLTQPCGLIGFGEHIGSLVDELDALPAN